MTSILPFMEQAAVWNTIDSKQPWTAPKNQGVFTNLIPAYISRSSSGKPDGWTAGGSALLREFSGSGKKPEFSLPGRT